MRHNLLKSIAVAGILLFGLSYSAATAQDRDDQSWYQNRDSFYHGEWRMRMFGRVRDDLDHVQASAFSGSDQYRISRTKDQLSSLQSELTAGTFGLSSPGALKGFCHGLPSLSAVPPQMQAILR